MRTLTLCQLWLFDISYIGQKNNFTEHRYCWRWKGQHEVRQQTLLTKTEFDDFMQSGFQDWTCRICAESLFQLNHAVENEDFFNSLNEFYIAAIFNDSEYMKKKDLIPSS